MNIITKFFHELFNPHCLHCLEEKRIEREESKEERVCNSCEILKTQVEQLRYDNEKLLNRMLEKPSVPSQPEVDNTTPIRMGRHIPWNVRRQALEAEDRQKAKLMREAPKPIHAERVVTTETTTDELESELGLETELKNAEKERENQISTKS